MFVCYGGKWDMRKNKYVGGALKGIVIRKGIKYEEFVAEVFRRIEVDEKEFDLRMRWKFDFKVGNEYPPIEICNDDDLQFYMLSDNLLQVPLCISIERKSISGSNQVDCGNAEDAIFEVFGNALSENALDENALDENALDENALHDHNR